MNCDNCSKCCEDIILPLAFEPNEDIKHWIEFHNIEVKGKMIRIKNKCEKLVNGKCSIYENRPENCKNFFCEKYA